MDHSSNGVAVGTHSVCLDTIAQRYPAPGPSRHALAVYPTHPYAELCKYLAACLVSSLEAVAGGCCGEEPGNPTTIAYCLAKRPLYVASPSQRSITSWQMRTPGRSISGV